MMSDSPRKRVESGELPTWKSASGHVTCKYELDRAGIFRIIEYWADPPGQGHGTQGLKELKSQYKMVIADLVEGAEIIDWWVRKAREGLVDMVFGDDGRQHWPAL